MKLGFYQKLAADGIRKNKRMYLPYILTCIIMVMMDYLIFHLHYSRTVGNMRGGEQTQTILGLGGWVIAVFAGIFLFYTNSFLIRRRKKEFGLYNILGMERRHLGIILFWENLFVAVGSILVGMAAGILFSKLAELALCNVLKETVSFAVSFAPQAVKDTSIVFGVIFLLIFINGLRQVFFTSALALMKSENYGEKPPKANWLFGIAGVVLLGIAYWLAVSIRDPLTAIFIFFLAVIMVIAATYLIMIAGSVMFCRILQKNKSYYYKPAHFVSVSSMVYRMKRNGAGLASICILATMVLVMISSTASLYFGSEDALRTQFSREMNVSARFADMNGFAEENIAGIKGAIEKEAANAGMTIQNAYDFTYATVAGALIGNEVEVDRNAFEGSLAMGLDSLHVFYFLPISVYNAQTGSNVTLEQDEAIISSSQTSYKESTLTFKRAATLRVKEVVKSPEDLNFGYEPSPVIVVYVEDMHYACDGLATMMDAGMGTFLGMGWEFHFDTGLSGEEQIAAGQQLRDNLGQYGFRYERCLIESREANRADFLAGFGGLFFLGILLSIVFIIAAVLIIYYKQISEGYEDQARFDIMKKVGMTGKEIRKSINSQLLTVFYLPLVLAGLHICFAFPIIRKLLQLFGLVNWKLFAGVSLLCFAIFSLFYAVIYRITSNAYFNIVNSKKD